MNLALDYMSSNLCSFYLGLTCVTFVVWKQGDWVYIGFRTLGAGQGFRVVSRILVLKKLEGFGWCAYTCRVLRF